MSYEAFLYQLAGAETLDSSPVTNTTTITLTDALLLEHAVAKYTSTSGVGNRTVALQIQDGSNAVIAQMAGDVNQAASLTRSYVFSRGCPSDAAFVGSVLQRPLHLYRLEVGWKIVLADLANIAAGDSFRFTLTVRRIRANL